MTINKKRKLGPKTVDCTFLGYAAHSVGYRFLIINSRVHDMHVGTIMESRDVTFFENEFSMKSTPNISNHEYINFPEQFILIEQTENLMFTIPRRMIILSLERARDKKNKVF